MAILHQDITTARNPFLTFEEPIKEQPMHRMQEGPIVVSWVLCHTAKTGQKFYDLWLMLLIWIIGIERNNDKRISHW